VYLDAGHRFTIKEEPIPAPGPEEALVRVRANGICGSDIHFFREGRLGNFVVTDPYLPGHEACGVVEALGQGVRNCRVGDRVVIEPGVPCGRCEYCRGGRYNLCPGVVFLSAPPTDGTFCDYLAIRADCLHLMPEGMTFEQGAMVEPAAVAVHAVNRARVAPGASGLILGCGPIGLLALQAFKASGGCHAICVDQARSRAEKAGELGADRVFSVEDHPDLTDSADVVFETAGSSAATALAFQCARPGGTVVQVGWPEENCVSLDIAAFLGKELDYVSVNRYANAFPTAIEWISGGRIETDALVTHRFGLDATAEAFQFASEHRDEVIKAIVAN
jgi:L-iditol 2-dehydrogenase